LFFSCSSAIAHSVERAIANFYMLYSMALPKLNLKVTTYYKNSAHLLPLASLPQAAELKICSGQQLDKDI